MELRVEPARTGTAVVRLDGTNEEEGRAIIAQRAPSNVVVEATMLSAAEAETLGLVNVVVPDDALEEKVAEWAQQLAAGPAVALSLTKTLLNQSFGLGLEQALDAEACARAFNRMTDDTAEALNAFLHKREPCTGDVCSRGSVWNTENPRFTPILDHRLLDALGLRYLRQLGDSTQGIVVKDNAAAWRGVVRDEP